MPTEAPARRMEAATTAARPARILVVDDHPIICSGYRRLLDRHPDLQICDEAGTEAEAMEKIEKIQPDVVLVDLSLASGHGMDLVKQVHARYPQIRLLVVSAQDEKLFAERSLKAGALGYISKVESCERLVNGIRTVLEGRVYLSEAMTTRLLTSRAAAPLTPASSPIECLSDRELAVFQMLGRGMTSRQIGSKLHLSSKTVDRYRENIKGKLHLANATELIQRATQWVLENG